MTAYGEEFTIGKHTQGAEVKAITYSAMQILDRPEVDQPQVFVIVDIWLRRVSEHVKSSRRFLAQHDYGHALKPVEKVGMRPALNRGLKRKAKGDAVSRKARREAALRLPYGLHWIRFFCTCFVGFK